MAFELLGKDQLHQVGMPVEDDAVQLSGLPLGPVRPGPDGGDGGAMGLRGVALDLEPGVMVAPRRVHVGDHLESPFLGRVVHRGQEVEEVEVEVRFIPEERGDLLIPRRGDGDHGVAVDIL